MRKHILGFCIGIVLGFLATNLLYILYCVFLPTPGDIVSMNSATLNDVARVSEILHENSDLMSRFAHYQVPHDDVPYMLCPECSDNVFISPIVDYGSERNSPHTTIIEVYDDALEMHNAISAIKVSLLVQQETLRKSLERHRNE